MGGWGRVSLSQPGVDGMSVTQDFSRFVLWTSRNLVMPSQCWGHGLVFVKEFLPDL